MKKLKNNQRRRLEYQADLRRKSTLESKIDSQSKVVRSKMKSVNRKKDGQIIQVSKKLTDAELIKERSKLELLRTELAKIKESLKYSGFDYKSSNRVSVKRARRDRSNFNLNTKRKRLNRVIGLLNVGKENEKLTELKIIVEKTKDTEYSDLELKKDIIRFLNTYNKGIPFTSLSKETLEEIKEILKGIN